MTDEEMEIAYQLVLAGRLHALVMHDDSPRELKALSKQISPDMLQAFLEKNPNFVFAEVVQQAIRLARTFKSLSSKG